MYITMDSQIELQYLVEYCKRLPTYDAARPITELIREWGVDNDAVSESSLAVREVREFFRMTCTSMEATEQKKLPIPETERPELPELRFFTKVSTDKFDEFKDLLRECIMKMNVSEGKKDWFCLYAAWRYYCNEREKGGGFVDFFIDIDTIFPGLLKDIKPDDKTNRRFKPYCDMLGNEYKRWAVADGVLPPMALWAHEEWVRHYNNSRDKIKRMQGLVRDFHLALIQLLGKH